eukprot:TRINITY_DN23115_c0_g1_i1.p1 TRINITY_DN23115_c0_g1~~TRINITY_DN23115_c0_g1_i1.p1  ORF type:complete len:216 (-),score=37.12 TRINITY_DN23115_c0_g1_i1:334-981(-)
MRPEKAHVYLSGRMRRRLRPANALPAVNTVLVALVLGLTPKLSEVFAPSLGGPARHRRALLLGGIGLTLGPQQTLAVEGSASDAAKKLRECEVEARSIMSGLSSGASNALAMSPGQMTSAGKAPPKMGTFEVLDAGPCSLAQIRSAADTLAALASSPSTAGLNRVQRQKLQDGPKRLVEARQAIVEANARKQGARLFGAVSKYFEATTNLLVAVP